MLLYVCKYINHFLEYRGDESNMQVDIMGILGPIYIWTWFVWPFLFVNSLVNGIGLVIKGETSKKYIVVAGISLLMMLSGFNLLLFG